MISLHLFLDLADLLPYIAFELHQGIFPDTSRRVI